MTTTNEQRAVLVFIGDPDQDGGQLDSAWLTRRDAEKRANELAENGHPAWSQSLVTRTNPWLLNPDYRPVGDSGDWWDSL